MRRTSTRRRTSVYRAKLETSHYEFDAFGSTAEEAVTLLENAWQVHVIQARRGRGDYDIYSWDEVKGDVYVREVQIGASYRDGEFMAGR